jgi:hypothetical protein
MNKTLKHTCVCGYSDDNGHTHTCDNQCIAYLAARIKQLEKDHDVAAQINDKVLMLLDIFSERLGYIEEGTNELD